MQNVFFKLCCSTSTNLKRKTSEILGTEDAEGTEGSPGSCVTDDNISDEEIEEMGDERRSGASSRSAIDNTRQSTETRESATSSLTVPPQNAVPRPRQKITRLSKKVAKNDVEAEIVAAIRAYSTSASNKTESTKPPPDQFELYANSLVPDFKRIAGISQHKFALLKAKIASLMLEIEFGGPEETAAAAASTTYEQATFMPLSTQRSDRATASLGSGFLPFPISRLSTPSLPYWSIDSRYQRQSDSLVGPWHGGFGVQSTYSAVPSSVPTCQSEPGNESLSSVLGSSITYQPNDDDTLTETSDPWTIQHLK
jgi:hypothetical protein